MSVQLYNIYSCPILES